MLQRFSLLQTSQLKSHSFRQRLSTKRFSRNYASEQQDVVIIGGGPGGYVAAIKAAQLGLKTTCVEKRGALGGTCLNVGCIPSKALLHASHLFDQAKNDFDKHGIIVDNPRIDLAKMMKGKETAVTGLTKGIEGLFKKNGVTYEIGHGKILSANEVEVVDNNGAKKVINTKNIVIATGSDAMALPGLEIDEETIITSTGALSLKKVPKHMVIVGAGVIGLELGSVWARLGAEVTVVEYTNAVAAGADGEVAKEFKKLLTKQGMKFVMQTQVLGATKDGENYKVKIKDLKKETESEIVADVILVSIGRRPYTDNLGLENVGVNTNKRGFIEIDDHWKTNVPGIFAIGDVVPGPMLAHKAEEEGVAIAENLASPGVGHVNYDAIPSVVYTEPEVAWVGKTEEQLKEAGIKYKVGKFPFAANSRARTNQHAPGFVKFLADSETDRILGCHMIGPNVGEMIQEATLGMEYGASSEDIGRTCHAHPTLSEAVKEAALATFAKPIHF
eukprot:TRINITY_DN372_c0_g1_i1.p1 TRINITY_DN372_c0_g1~~TRINITY_DN372_c0_g1_i1.p1  ORF type:complete len:501 (+),score=157.16 TRINITY_DN372_c0_g1_i1:179-1681(+)